MKTLLAILWFQFMVGLVGVFLSFAGVHTGALSIEWTTDLHAEYARLAAAPGFQAPPEVMGLGHDFLVRSLRHYAKSTAMKSLYCLLLSGGLALMAGIGLWLTYRLRGTIYHALLDPNSG
jgi:hypothetical protein